jgi:D-glycero-D-manno-heptose 1,7-bisphosphate phosphatase
MRPAVFLDLNGTLVMPVQVTSPDDYTLIEGSIDAVGLLMEAGFICPVVTVQSRIEKGIYTEHAFLHWFSKLQQKFLSRGAELLGPYLCPHSFKTLCSCHKPQPTLFLQAARELGIDCTVSYAVGDTIDDIRAGAAIGAKRCFVLTGWAQRYITEFGDEADFIGENILAVAQWIVEDARKLAIDTVETPE